MLCAPFDYGRSGIVFVKKLVKDVCQLSVPAGGVCCKAFIGVWAPSDGQALSTVIDQNKGVRGLICCVG